MNRVKRKIKKKIRTIFFQFFPEFKTFNFSFHQKEAYSSIINSLAKMYAPYYIVNSQIDEYTYIAKNSSIINTHIGKFCSIGPNFCCGWGIHPLNGISTSPVFYSTKKQVGVSFSLKDKIEEHKNIIIGNDVFIGINVTVLDGVKINDGAVIGAGAVVVDDVDPYSIVAGVPAKHIKYRFDLNLVKELHKIKWWDFEESKLKDVEKYFFAIESFILKYKENK
ncbi:CatB-related O-acetyltransferase [Sediminispirochaeta smaragdinae]|uniref:Acetyltransferase (Isoleucine patch superfamily) n=1 Tax=Sediminispirochaeta smaragdinae (strain DSM 11293 / JCM 15392 / SEBR 4228) TaxID=573413 RepID=E1RA16_SEDSS|nr:CatB-related O-acetyltransferase [Sediminispirochaeta smaragdinae]ADK83335.1 Acetyltransferase (isoleucine patch superfamily) [Sediminispirochaeta smaragdinae DSM 11293]